jgi:hypothetical protein
MDKAKLKAAIVKAGGTVSPKSEASLSAIQTEPSQE